MWGCVLAWLHGLSYYLKTSYNENPHYYIFTILLNMKEHNPTFFPPFSPSFPPPPLLRAVHLGVVFGAVRFHAVVFGPKSGFLNFERLPVGRTYLGLGSEHLP